MITLRQRIFLISSLVIGLLVALLLLYLYVFKPRINQPTIPEGTVNQPIGQTTGGQPGPSGSGGLLQQYKAPADPDDLYAKQVTKNFVERFGTYSNQNNNINIDDVIPMATPVMVKWLETQRLKQESDYRGSTAKAVSTIVQSLSDKEASVEVGVQFVNVTASSSEIVYRTGKVVLLKSNNEWLVDGLYWNKE